MSAGAVIELDAGDRLPTPSQQRFLDSRARIAALLGGYGSGKTSTGAEKALDLIAENPGCSGIIVAPTYGQLEKAALRSFFDPEAPDAGACPKEWIAEVNIGKRYFLHPNGARTYWGSADNPKSLEGQNLAWFWMDEPGDCKRRAYQVLVGRLRDKAAKWIQGFVTGTPRPGWMWEEFNSGKAEQDIIHASTRENAANLAPGTIEALERTYSTREARVLIDGEFGLLVGAVLEEFERKRHLIEWRYDPRFRTMLVLDFGYRRPYAGWAQELPPGTDIPGRGKAPRKVEAHELGTWVIFDELVPENLSTELLLQQVKAKGYRVDATYCDPAGDGSQPAVGISDVQLVRAAGFQPKFVTAPRLRHIPFGIALLRGLLCNVRRETRLWVAKSLDNQRAKRGVVKDFEGYAYPEAKDGKPVGDEPLKDGLHDHGVDGWRYGFVNEAVRAGGFPEQLRVG